MVRDLEKKNKLRNIWTPKYFVLEGNTLRYFIDCYHVKEKGRIEFIDLDFKIVTTPEGKEFHIKTEAQIYYLRAATKDQGQKWINALEDLKIGINRVFDPEQLS